MKAKIMQIKRFAVHDGEGIRTTVFFKGCPLRCVWCHNPEGIAPQSETAYFPHKCIGCGECATVCPAGAHAFEGNGHVFHRARCIACGNCAEVCLGNALVFYGTEKSVDELLHELLKDKEFYQTSGGGVTLSGGECLLQADFCAELLKKLKENGVHTAVDTCGFVPQTALDKVMPYTDIFLYDIKALDEEVHKQGTGQGNRQILENLLFLDEKGCKTEIRVPLIPNYNEKEMEKIAEFIKPLKHVTKIEVLPYHNYAGSKYDSLGMPNTLPARMPTDEELAMATAILSNTK